MNHVFDGYEPFKGEIVTRHQGSLIAFETGDSVTYGLYAAQERGRLFIGAGVPVYEGMIVGASPKSEDITVNVCKKKHIRLQEKAYHQHPCVRLRRRAQAHAADNYVAGAVSGIYRGRRAGGGHTRKYPHAQAHPLQGTAHEAGVQKETIII